MKEAEDALRDYQGQLERVFNEVRDLEKHAIEPSESVEADQMMPEGMTTAVDKSLLARIGDAHLAIPEDFTVHPRVQPVLDKRREMAYEGKVDWAFGELLALGTLVAEGKLIRLTGQDTRRGTFTQRHSVIIDRKNGDEFTPLQLLTANEDGTPTGGKFMVYDSPLSEFATVGFEYGYSVGNPDAMVLWEAQFGDFLNGAQSIIDEFISSGEAKWGQTSDVVLLLPHGHEGQGPDHTSGRIERFLQLCAEGSMTVAPAVDAGELLPSAAPALTRRHPPPADRVHPEVDAAQQGRGQRHQGLHRTEVPVRARGTHLRGRHRRPRQGDPDPDVQRQAVLRPGGTQGQGQARGRGDRADRAALPVAARGGWAGTLDSYPNASEFFWVQEEPANQGAWPTFGLALPELLPDKLTGIKRISRRAMSRAVIGLVEGARRRAAGDPRRGIRPVARESASSRPKHRGVSAGDAHLRRDVGQIPGRSSGMGGWPLANEATAPGQKIEIARPVNIVAGPSGRPISSATLAATSASPGRVAPASGRPAAPSTWRWPGRCRSEPMVPRSERNWSVPGSVLGSACAGAASAAAPLNNAADTTSDATVAMRLRFIKWQS